MTDDELRRIIHGCAHCGGGVLTSTEAKPLFCSARCVEAAEKAWTARAAVVSLQPAEEK